MTARDVGRAECQERPRAASRLLLVAELDYGLDAFELGGRRRQRAQRGRSAPLPADDAAEIARRHEQLDERLPAMRPFRHPHGVGTIRQGARDELDEVARAAHDAGCSVGCSGAGACGSLATSVLTVSDGCAPLLNQ